MGFPVQPVPPRGHDQFRALDRDHHLLSVVPDRKHGGPVLLDEVVVVTQRFQDEREGDPGKAERGGIGVFRPEQAQHLVLQILNFRIPRSC